MSFIGNVLLIVGGFVIAETIVRTFLSLAEGVLHWFILPAMGLLMVIMANNLLQNNPEEFGKLREWMGSIYLILMVVFIVLLKKSLIPSSLFLWMALGFPVLYFSILFFIWIKKKSKSSTHTI